MSRTERISSRLDAAISAAFPGWGAGRAVARMQLEALAYIQTLSPLRSDRGTGRVPNDPTSLDDKIPYHDRLAMIDLFDTEFCQSPLMCGIADAFVRNTVPAVGLQPIPDTGSADFDRELTKRFADYAADCEVRGHSLAALQQILLKSAMGHGDAAIFHLPDGRLQGICAAKIATPQIHASREGTDVHQGVYTGPGTAPLGIYTIPRDRWGGYRQDSTRYLDASMYWWFSRPDDFDSYRGRSAYLAAFPHLRMLRSILKYKEFQTKMASVFGIAITKDKAKASSPLSRLGTGNSAAEARGEALTTATRPDIELFSGMGITLNQDEDLKVIEAKLNAGDFEAFVRLVVMFIGVTCGLPLEFCLLDWTKATYYGNRMAAHTGYRTFMDWWTIPSRLVRLVWRERVAAWIADGTISIPAGIANDPTHCSVTLPPPIEVDGEKELKVTRMKLESNLGSAEDYARQQGDTFGRIVEARKREIEMQKKAGLPIPATLTPGIQLLSDLDAGAVPQNPQGPPP